MATYKVVHIDRSVQYGSTDEVSLRELETVLTNLEADGYSIVANVQQEDAQSALILELGGGAGTTVDVSDRAARVLGVVSLDASISANSIGIEGTVDVSDRATRELGIATLGASLSANNNIGKVGSEGDSISQTPVVTAGAYAAGDAVGGLLTFVDAARISGDGGVIKDMLIIDDAGQDAEMELWLFDSPFTAMVDNAAWAPSEADLRKLVAIISTGDGAWFDAGTPSVARVEAAQRYDCTGLDLFGQLVTRGTPTFAATDDVTCVIGLLID